MASDTFWNEEILKLEINSSVENASVVNYSMDTDFSSLYRNVCSVRL